MALRISHILVILHLTMLFEVSFASNKTVGTLEITFHQYNNPTFTKQDGYICEWGYRTCDLRFFVYVTSKTKGDKLNFAMIDEYMWTTGVVFTDRIGKLNYIRNPIKIDLTDEDFQRRHITLDVNVDDRDGDGPPQRVDTMSFKIILNAPLAVAKEVLYTPGRIHFKKASLIFGYSLKCTDPNMYGKMCTKNCVPQNSVDNGHYLCDPEGNKVCMPGWIDPIKNCKVPSLCSSRPCLNGGTCIDLPKDNMFWCECPKYFTGQVCETAQHPCSSTDCLNGGTCVRDGTGTVTCLCPMGYNGSKCETDTNRCLSHSPCGDKATCYAQSKGYTCGCPPGAGGSNCKDDVDECTQKSGNPCAHGGTCVNTPGSFSCLCPAGLTGALCETDIDECEQKPPPCAWNQKCENTVGSHVCYRVDVDDCKGVVCGGGGVCVDMPLKYYCKCQDGFSGANCSYSVTDAYFSQLNTIGGGVATTATMGLAVVAVVVSMATVMALHPNGM